MPADEVKSLFDDLEPQLKGAGIEILHDVRSPFGQGEDFIWGCLKPKESDPAAQQAKMQAFLDVLKPPVKQEWTPSGQQTASGWGPPPKKEGAPSERNKTPEWYLVTMLATDVGQGHASGPFTIYYLFSCRWPTSDQERRALPKREPFLLIEYHLLAHPQANIRGGPAIERDMIGALQHGAAYPSIAGAFRAAERFEREIRDMFDLVAYRIQGKDEDFPGTPESAAKPGLLLFPDQYPKHFAPLRKDQEHTLQQLREKLSSPDVRLGKERSAPQPREGQIVVPVGPIHAGVIEAGCFYLTIGRERIEHVEIQLGFKHRGIEKLFEEQCQLAPMAMADVSRPDPTTTRPVRYKHGWELAENVSGDSAFAHSLAYCQAVETLLGIDVPESVAMLRGIFLELERMVNHIGDCAALARDVSQELLFSEISVLREYLLRLNARLTGHRLLMGVNQPGAISLLKPSVDRMVQHGVAASINDPIASISWKHLPLPFAGKLPNWLTWLTFPRFRNLQMLVDRFAYLGEILLGLPNFQTRTEGIGSLSLDDAKTYGATGLMARASGINRDMRLTHPSGIYDTDWLKKDDPTTDAQPQKSWLEKVLTSGDARSTGDILSRVEQRLDEVQQSYGIIERILGSLSRNALEAEVKDVIARKGEPPRTLFGQAIKQDDIDKVQEGSFAWGYVEGWRGDVVYFVMKGKGNIIARCAVRDPSFLNWSAFPYVLRTAAFADFPLINKSCNLSYAGHDR
jgi:Ni,Fe-hydrogenase III large subunit